MTVDDRLRLRRLPDRGHYERATIDAILDEARICHVGFVDGGQPFVMPTIHARDGDALYLHGSRGSRMLRVLASGAPVCVTASILDGLVLARSAFHHSMNYRSVVVIGTATEIEGDEKLAALRAISEHLLPGRWDDVRPPNGGELRQTAVLRVPLDKVSAKIRTGPPTDDEEDLDVPTWAGELALALVPVAVRPDDRSRSIPDPEYLRAGGGKRSSARSSGP